MYLNIQKAKLIFHPISLKIDPSIKFKLQGKQLIPTESVKYLGVLLYEHLQLTKQLSNVKIKLNRANGIYGKLSAKYNCILDWNKFKKYFSHSKLKTLIKRQILNKY